MAELISIECELAKKLGLKHIPAERLRTYADDMDIAAVSLKDMLHTCESFLGRFKADGGNIIDPQVLAEGKYRMRALPLECVLNAVDNLSVRAFVLNERARDIDEGAFDIVDECVEWTLECLNDDVESRHPGLLLQESRRTVDYVIQHGKQHACHIKNTHFLRLPYPAFLPLLPDGCLSGNDVSNLNE